MRKAVLPAALLLLATGRVPLALAQDLPAAPQRPAIGLNRWQEDWSVLADPALRTEPLDALKYIPLGAGASPAWLSLGGGLRERIETNHAPLFHTVAGLADTYLLSRLELHGDVRAGPFQAFVQLQSDFAPGKQRRTMVDADRLGLEQGFVALVAPLGHGTIKLRAGRQQFAFDLQRFVAVRDGPNVRQSFDALWADFEAGRWRLIGYYTQPVINRDGHAFDDFSSAKLRFFGARIERQVLGRNELSAYWSRYDNRSAAYAFAAGAERRDVWDVRFAGKAANGTDALDWDAEAMAQTGRIAARAIRAWAAGARIGYTVAGWPGGPRLGVQIDAASGNRHGAAGAYGTFNPLFPNGDYVNLAGYTGYANLVHAKGALTLHPTKRIKLLAAGAAQWRMTGADAVYAQPNVPVPRSAGQPGLWTGAYGQARSDVTISPRLSAALEFDHFNVGSTLRAINARDSDYLGVEAKFQW